MQKSMFTAAVLAVLAAPSFAGGPVAVAQEPVVVAPVAPAVEAVDWTGGYVGLSFGAASGDAEADGLSFDYDNGTAASILAGYNIQNGSFVYGAELGYTSVSDMVLSGEENGGDDTFDSLVDLRGRLGYSTGNALFYGALGYAWADTTINGTDSASADGLSLGLGVDYLVTETVFVGLDYTSRNLEGSNDNPDNAFDFDTSMDTVSFRVGLTF